MVLDTCYYLYISHERECESPHGIVSDLWSASHLEGRRLFLRYQGKVRITEVSPSHYDQAIFFDTAQINCRDHELNRMWGWNNFSPHGSSAERWNLVFKEK